MPSYSDLAAFMAEYPDLFILRTFSELSAKNLLYYQAELANLEVELKEIEQKDRSSTDPILQKLDQRWFKLSEATRREIEVQSTTAGSQNQSGVGLPMSRDTAQWKKFLKIRKVLAEYNAALLQQLQISALLPPHKKDLQELRGWFGRRGFGLGFLSGSQENVWEEKKNNTDLVAFQTSRGLIYEISRFLLYLFRLCCSCVRRPKDHVYHINGSPEGGIGNAVVTIISSVIPVVPIIALFFINHLFWRLIFISGFTGALAAGLIFGISMKSDQVLAITTAVAAIQVVYVGSVNQTKSEYT